MNNTFKISEMINLLNWSEEIMNKIDECAHAQWYHAMKYDALPYV